MRFCAIIGILWFFALPYISQEVFTSENAISGNYLASTLRENTKLISIFEEHKRKIEPLASRAEIKEHLLPELSKRMETYMQPLDTVKHGQNIYSFIRSKDGPGLECLAIAVPITSKAGLEITMTFIDLMM